MSVDLVAIDDICELVRGSSPRPQGDPRYFGGSVPRLMVADMTRDGMYVTPSIDSLTEEGAKQSRPMKAGEVVMVVSGLVGLPSILKIDACIHDGLVGFRNLDKNVMPEYLYYWLLNSQEKTRTQTAGAIWQNLTTDQIKEWKLPLPPLTEQKRIASLLARADHLRHLRRTAHDLGESLLQSVFLEMFGDPISNSKHWEQATIKELGKVVTGSTPPSEVEGMFGGYIPFITPGDLTVDTLKSQRYVTEEGAKKSRVVRAGSTLVCCIGATIGKTDIAKAKCAFNQQINAIEWDENIQDDFGLIMMTFFSRIVAERGISTTLPILKKSEFEEIVIPVPPLNLQEEFAGVVARVESLRGRMSEGERQVEGLFESLLAESFGGAA